MKMFILATINLYGGYDIDSIYYSYDLANTRKKEKSGDIVDGVLRRYVIIEITGNVRD